VTSQISAVSNYSDNQRQDSILVPEWLGVRAQHSDIPVAVAEASFSTMSIVEIPTTSRFHSPESGVAEENYPMEVYGDEKTPMWQPNMPRIDNVPLHHATKSTSTSTMLSKQPVGIPGQPTVQTSQNINSTVSCSTLTPSHLTTPRSPAYGTVDTPLGRGSNVNNDDHLRGERNRLMTFRQWPTSANARPEALAEAGFYYMEVGDIVRCVFCRGSLKNWEVSDDPRTEHKKFYPGCPFLLHENVGNVPLRNIEPLLKMNEGVSDSNVQIPILSLVS